MKLRIICLISIGVSYGLGGVANANTVLNLTNVTIDGIAPNTMTVGSTVYSAGQINGAYFRRPLTSEPIGSGSGVYRRLFKIQQNNTESGYNRDAVFNSQVTAGYNAVIRISDLRTSLDGGYYVFSLDTNESGGGSARFLSMSDFRLYIGGASDPTTLPTTVGTLGNLGTKVYDMNAGGQQNYIFTDYSIFDGSGKLDMQVFIPISLMAGYSTNSLVYLYSDFGKYTSPNAGVTAASLGLDSTNGFEEWSIPDAASNSNVLVPEPSVGLVLAASGMLLGMIRRRSKSV